MVDAICSGKENVLAPIEHSVDSNSSVFDEKIDSAKKLDSGSRKSRKTTPRSDKSVQTVNTLQTKTKPVAKNATLQAEITEIDVRAIFSLQPLCFKLTFFRNKFYLVFYTLLKRSISKKTSPIVISPADHFVSPNPFAVD